jgi:predicted nuclease of predicted toxin-antitoxin system
VPLRLLFDEDLSPRVARDLVELGYDATSVHDRGRLGKKDWQLFPWCQQERFTVCTANSPDWEELAADCLGRGESHYGILAVDNQWGTDGVLRAILDYLGSFPQPPEPPINQVIHLPPP